jgi:hypothetical protein
LRTVLKVPYRKTPKERAGSPVAKRTVLDHPKFINLKVELAMSKAEAIGYLECLWHFCARFTPAGNIGKYPNEQIEAWLEWKGEKGRLVAAMTRTGWLDECPENRLVVHDWADHCDEATKKSMKRAGITFCTPATPRPNSEPLIYFIQDDVTKFIKIGFTEGSVSSRIDALQTGNPNKLIALATYPGTKTEEKKLHERFKSDRALREWFRPSAALLAYVADIGRQNPPALPSLALPSPALPEPSDVRSPPEPLERKREEIFADLPKALNVPKFREAWGLWERYRVDSGHGCVQPMSRIQNWHDLEKFGAVKAESLVRNAIAKGWKQIHYDAKVPDIKPPPDPHRIDPVLARLRAEDAAAEKSAYQGGKTREALKREAG